MSADKVTAEVFKKPHTIAECVYQAFEEFNEEAEIRMVCAIDAKIGLINPDVNLFYYKGDVYSDKNCTKESLLLTKEKAEEYANFIDRLVEGLGGDIRTKAQNIKYDKIWRELYCHMPQSNFVQMQVSGMRLEKPVTGMEIEMNQPAQSILPAQAVLMYMNNKGMIEGGLGYKEDGLIPCHHCGLIVRFHSVQVDHYMPKSTGEDASVIKMLRTLGLTQECPSNRGKGSQFSQQRDSPKGWEGLKGWKIYPHENETGKFLSWEKKKLKSSKWTTTGSGNAFLSLLYSSSKATKIAVDRIYSMRMACVHSKLNLVPLCAYCNQKKSNKMKYVEAPSIKLNYLFQRIDKDSSIALELLDHAQPKNDEPHKMQKTQ